MKKLAILLISALTAFCLTACGNTEESASSDEPITITIPASFIEQMGQDNINNLIGSDSQSQATMNEDGSMQLTFTREQYGLLLNQLKTNIDSALSNMSGSSDYPNIKEIKANDDFSNFEVYLNSGEVGLTESMATLVLYMYGGIFSTFAPDPNVDNIHVDFINAETGDVIQSSDSKDLGNSE